MPLRPGRSATIVPIPLFAISKQAVDLPGWVNHHLRRVLRSGLAATGEGSV
jgi:hypothetical protein